jgi:[CysO sulfur-carrier protein]-S-L-cysteine hydrolase
MGRHPGSVQIRAPVLERIIAHARADWPLECCGLLAGGNEVVTAVFPAVNALHSEREFFIAPRELVATLRRIRELALQHLGIYHSHPQSENVP